MKNVLNIRYQIWNSINGIKFVWSIIIENQRTKEVTLSIWTCILMENLLNQVGNCYFKKMLKIKLTFEDVYLINTTTTTFFSNSTFFRYFPKISGKKMIIRSLASKLFLKHQNNCSLHFRKVALKIFRI